VIYRFDAELWLWDARKSDSWTFLRLPVGASEEIREYSAGAVRAGFGSVRVAVTIGGTSWTTSIFPDSAAGVYVLPIKKAVRTAEKVEHGDVVHVTLELA
jgi:hypothetical protein